MNGLDEARREMKFYAVMHDAIKPAGAKKMLLLKCNEAFLKYRELWLAAASPGARPEVE